MRTLSTCGACYLRTEDCHTYCNGNPHDEHEDYEEEEEENE
jgi:hypothetical protein